MNFNIRLLWVGQAMRGIALAMFLPTIAFCQAFKPNYDEAAIPAYTLPDPLITSDGATITDANDWEKQRNFWLNRFTTEMFGTPPNSRFETSVIETESGEALGGTAIRRQLRLQIETEAGKLPIEVLVYLPTNRQKPVGCFLGLNFRGNHTTQPDPAIWITKSWCPADNESGVVDNKATEAGRGARESRWPAQQILDGGYALATVYCGDIDPDFDDGFQNGVHGLFPQHKPDENHPDRWGTIAAWSWGLSRVLDLLVIQPELNPEKVMLVGHSRLGKTSLWASATDPRFAIAISNNSGCGGAALSRRRIGETVQRINTSFPHWFCGNFKKYNLNEDQLPFDQHILLATIAPRPVYVASATEDQWADPRGEFLSLWHAGSVFKLFGKEALTSDIMPKPDAPVQTDVGYHLRTGKHDITSWDWAQYIRFADNQN